MKKGPLRALSVLRRKYCGYGLQAIVATVAVVTPAPPSSLIVTVSPTANTVPAPVIETLCTSPPTVLAVPVAVSPFVPPVIVTATVGESESVNRVPVEKPEREAIPPVS